MRTTVVLAMSAVVLAARPMASQVVMSDDQLSAAMAEGAKYRTRDAYLDKGTKGNACKIAGLWSMDGISKELRFFTDYDAVASASAAAQAEMRAFGIEDAKRLPLTGLLLANVQMTARGMIPVQRLRSNYASKGVHLVLALGDSIIQPMRKEQGASAGNDGQIGVLYTWYNAGNASLLTGIPLGMANERFQQEFAFPVSPDSLPESFKAYLIDGDGKRKEVNCKSVGLRR